MGPEKGVNHSGSCASCGFCCRRSRCEQVRRTPRFGTQHCVMAALRIPTESEWGRKVNFARRVEICGTRAGATLSTPTARNCAGRILGLGKIYLVRCPFSAVSCAQTRCDKCGNFSGAAPNAAEPIGGGSSTRDGSPIDPCGTKAKVYQPSRNLRHAGRQDSQRADNVESRGVVLRGRKSFAHQGFRVDFGARERVANMI